MNEIIIEEIVIQVTTERDVVGIFVFLQLMQQATASKRHNYQLFLAFN